MLRAETREKYPSSDEAAGHLHGQEFSLEEQSLQATEAADEDEANQPLSCVRPQGRDHCWCNHGRIPGMLGALLLRQYRRSLLQDLHISPSVPGAIFLQTANCFANSKVVRFNLIEFFLNFSEPIFFFS